MKTVLPLFIALVCCWQLARLPAPERAVQVASLYVGHQEVTTNRSHLIDYWNARLNLPMGSNYCASFVAFVLDSAQVVYPKVRSGVAQQYITNQSIPAGRVASGRDIPKGYLVVWKRGNTWMGHVEIVRRQWTGTGGLTIGANTSPGSGGDQRQGNGVWARERHIDPTAYFRITHFTPVR